MARVTIYVWHDKAVSSGSHSWRPIQVLLSSLEWCPRSQSDSFCHFHLRYTFLPHLLQVLFDSPALLLIGVLLGGVDLIEKLAELWLCLGVIDHDFLFPPTLVVSLHILVISILLLLLIRRIEIVHRGVAQDVLEGDWWLQASRRGRSWHIQRSWSCSCDLDRLCHSLTWINHALAHKW